MSEASIGIAITTFAFPDMLKATLTSIRRFGWPEVPVRVFQDRTDDEGIDEAYRAICDEFRVPLTKLAEWGCMHGSAQFAFENTPEDWVFYFPDDLLATRGAVDSVIRTVRELHESPAGLIQVPYWNAEELAQKGHIPFQDAPWQQPDLLESIPRNKHWDGPEDLPRLYINVNGAGFVARRKCWEAAGGFPKKTWCLDEALSCRTWFYTPWNIYTIPGPPFVHLMGGASRSPLSPPHSFHTMEAWEAEWGMTKHECGQRSYAAMATAGGDGTSIARTRLRE